MHELGLCEAVLDAVETRAAGRQVTGVRVRVGTLHRVVPDAFSQGFQLVSAGTVAEDAEVELVVLPVRSSCPTCHTATECDELPLACPSCGATEIEIEGGDELVLESIAVRAGTES